MRALLLIALTGFLCLVPDPAFAEEKAAEGEGGAHGMKTDDNVELPMLVAPVTVDGHLYHYAYMRVILTASSADMVTKANDKVPFILDALLREVHKSSIALDNDPNQIDGNGLKTRLLATANGVMGAGAFTALTFRDTIQTDGGESSAQQDQEAAAATGAPATPPEGEHQPAS